MKDAVVASQGNRGKAFRSRADRPGDRLAETIDASGPPPANGPAFQSTPNGMSGLHAEPRKRPASVEEFAGCLALSGLMSAEKLEAFYESLGPDESPRDAQALADLLVEYGRLTAYQASVLLEGHTRGLMLDNYEVKDRLEDNALELTPPCEIGNITIRRPSNAGPENQWQ